MDVQLWLLGGYKDVSSVAYNEVGSAGICVWRSWHGMTTLLLCIEHACMCSLRCGLL